MIFDSTSRANKKINTIFKLSCLISNRYSSVNGDDSEFFRRVLQFSELTGDLECKLASGGQHDSLNLSCAKKLIFAQVLDDGETESKSLTRSSKITSNHIFPCEHGLEACLLDREQIFIALRDHILDRSFRDVWEIVEGTSLGRIFSSP